MTYNKQQKGFALLMSLIVVSVVVSIGLTVLDLTLKQLRLSTNSKDSESAFHAANAGLECARYWRQSEADTMEAGGDISAACFGDSAQNISDNVDSAPVSVPVGVYRYEMETEWDAGNRCSQMSTLIIVSDNSAAKVVTGMETLVEGYPGGDSKTCAAGGRCTVITVKGYSRGCSQINVAGTVQREVLLEL